MLRMEAVAERMGDHVVGHHPPMPSAGKMAQAVVATCRLEDSWHTSMMTIVPYASKTVATATSVGVTQSRSHPGDRTRYGS
jgi:hypothetical protein